MYLMQKPQRCAWYAAINGRTHLQEPYKSYQKPYLPNCHSSGYVVHHDIQDYYRKYEGVESPSNTIGHLMRLAEQSKEGYDKVINLPHTMAVTARLTEQCYPNTEGFALPVISPYPADQLPSIILTPSRCILATVSKSNTSLGTSKTKGAR